MSDEKGMVIMFSIFAVFGAFMMIIGFREYWIGTSFKRIATETTAVISDIVVTPGRFADDDDTRTVYVTFNVDGQEYRGPLGAWHIGMAVGQERTVYYNPDNPQNFISDTSQTSLLVLVAFGAICFSIGFGYFFKRFRRNTSANSLIANGKRIMATLIELRPGNATMNEQRCFNLICEYRDETTGNVYLFKSADTWSLPPFDYQNQQTPLVPVYIDRYDYSKHFVAVDEFFDAIEAQNYITNYSQRVG